MTRMGWIAALVVAPGIAAADPQAVQDVIGSQIEAFRADDFATAFTYASPGIAAFFRDPENFGRMVRQGYPMVHRPAEVEFGRSEAVGPDWGQVVDIVDESGARHRLLYRMVETPAGWKIGGVQVVELPDVGA
ncbi:DUF4864 domain-containing protein [Jannaschia sp. Os4]|uniref:DUF4864 domain-containing protein n=1 Tax=Jannaschia sp. Os4 TaxID=2807617 RepID=UPI00193A31F0|nr:DUF4864 domain-containing protein [Jannaschia sp. Os4]MBM2575804.1 DUF4864 domain-containing protein [Jannaschia sp. Os4]